MSIGKSHKPPKGLLQALTSLKRKGRGSDPLVSQARYNHEEERLTRVEAANFAHDERLREKSEEQSKRIERKEAWLHAAMEHAPVAKETPEFQKPQQEPAPLMSPEAPVLFASIGKQVEIIEQQGLLASTPEATLAWAAFLQMMNVSINGAEASGGAFETDQQAYASLKQAWEGLLPHLNTEDVSLDCVDEYINGLIGNDKNQRLDQDPSLNPDDSGSKLRI